MPRRGPTPSTWSPLEYACHVRDVCRLFEERLALMLDAGRPGLRNWDQDATARRGPLRRAGPGHGRRASSRRRAPRSSPAYAQVPDDAWGRTGIRSNGSEFTVLTLGQYGLHDLPTTCGTSGSTAREPRAGVPPARGVPAPRRRAAPAAAPLGAVGADRARRHRHARSGCSPRWPRSSSTRWRPARSSSTSPRSPCSSRSWASGWPSTARCAGATAARGGPGRRPGGCSASRCR